MHLFYFSIEYFDLPVASRDRRVCLAEFLIPMSEEGLQLSNFLKEALANISGEFYILMSRSGIP